jgi:hypothetical protein
LGQKWTQIPHPLHQSRLIKCAFSFNFAIWFPVRSRSPKGVLILCLDPENNLPRTERVFIGFLINKYVRSQEDHDWRLKNIRNPLFHRMLCFGGIIV